MVSMTRPLAAPLRPLGTAEILDAAVRLVTRNLPAVLTIAVPFAILRTALAALLQYAAIQAKSTAVLEALATLVLATGLGVLLTGLLAPLYSADLLGSRMAAGGSLRRVGRTCFALVGLAVIVTVAESAGLVALSSAARGCGGSGPWRRRRWFSSGRARAGRCAGRSASSGASSGGPGGSGRSAGC
jgi:hypothetical protein